MLRGISIVLAQFWTLILILTLALGAAFAATQSASLTTTLALKEVDLKAYVKSGSPEVARQQAKVLNANISGSENRDKYSLKGFATGNYKTTKEKPFISFSPVYSPHSVLEVGLKRRFAYGVDSSLKVFSDMREFTLSGAEDQRSIAAFGLSLSLDLYKNLFGRLDRAQLKSDRLSLEMAQFRRRIADHNFLIGLRKLFWRLVSNDQAQAISKSLYGSAQKQVKNAEVRLRSSAADRGEVARYRALASSRQSRLIFLRFQRQELIQSLNKMVPDLLQRQIKVEGGNLDQVVQSVLKCVTSIKSYKQPPMQNTLYDELIAGVKSIAKQQLKLAQSYDDVDFKLSTTLSSKGVEPKQSDAFDESLSGDRTGFEIGFQLNVPLGLNSETAAQKVKLTQLRADYEAREILQDMSSAHQFIVRSIDLLLATVESQNTSRKNLKIRIGEMDRKYHQGRISVSEFISDQDSLFQTELEILDSKTLILNVLFNYLSIFTETPCAFNRL